MSAGSAQEALRRVLKEKVPPYSKNGLVRDLCEDVIQTFGSLYPDRALNLCMSIAQRLSTSDPVHKTRPSTRSSTRKSKVRRQGFAARPRRY